MSALIKVTSSGLNPVRARASNRVGRVAASITARVRDTSMFRTSFEVATRVDRASWDESVATLGGSPVQSWRWGELFAHNGFEVERVRIESEAGIAQAQVIYEQQGPFVAARVPRGPVLTGGNSEFAAQLIIELDRRAGARGAVSLTIEPDRPLPFVGRYADYGFVAGPVRWYPARTVRVPLVADDAFFAAMRSETRYQARLGVRRGLEISQVSASPANIARFYRLLEETSDRNAFFIEAESYYQDFMETFGDYAMLFFVENGDDLAAAAIMVMSGGEGIYMFGASSTTHRLPGAAAGMQVAMMRAARDRGCSVYDLWGIPEHDPEVAADGTVAPACGNDWSGLYRFKTGFGGEIVAYPKTVERRYHRLASVMARRLF